MSVNTKAEDLRKVRGDVDSEEARASLRAVCLGLRLLREARGMTQDEIGRLAKVPPASVSRYERALVLPNLETLHRILRALDVGFGELAQASEEVHTAQREGRQPDPLLLESPSEVDEDRVLAFFMSRVQSGRGLEYIEHLESWASRLRHLREFVKDYSARYEEEGHAEDDSPGRPAAKASES